MKKTLILIVLLAQGLGLIGQICTTFPAAPGYFSEDGGVFSNGDIAVGLVQFFPEYSTRVDRVDASGTPIWTRFLQTTNARIQLEMRDVAIAPNDEVLIAGIRHVEDTSGLTAYAYSNMFIVKLDAQGNILWSRIYQSHFSSEDYLIRVTALQNGKMVLSYSKNGNENIVSWLDAQGVPLTTKKLTAAQGISDFIEDVVAADNGDIFIINHYFLPGANSAGVSLTRIDDSGALLWSYGYDFGTDGFQVQSVEELASGAIVLGGYAEEQGVTNPGIIFLNSAGIYQNGISYDLGFDPVSRIHQQNSGDLILAGGGNAWMFKADISGVPTSPYLTSANFVDPRIFGEFGSSTVVGGNDAILVSNDGIDFSCVFSNSGVIGQVASPGYVSQITALALQIDSVQTWTMSLLGATPSPDVELGVQLSNTTPRPGFDMYYTGLLINNGTVTSGPITVSLKVDTLLTFISSTPPPSSVVNDSIIWSGLSPLALYGFETFQANFNVPADVTLLGAPLDAKFTVEQDPMESNFANNTFLNTDTIVGAYDPNDKLVSPEGVYDIQNDSVLYYTIRFQNTGTDTAFTVVVVDTLPQEVSVSSFQQGPASHAYSYELTAQGLLTFTFPNILLPDSNVNEAGSHGLVSFSIKPDAGLAVGTMISNSADIYFDFNPPIRTPPAIVSYGIVNSVPVVFTQEALTVFPVPVQDYLTIIKPESFKAEQLLIHSIDGRLVYSSRADYFNTQAIIPTDGLRPGVYIIILVNGVGERLSARVVKE